VSNTREHPMAFGVDLGRCNPRLWHDVARAADELGYESVWLPEHLIFPERISTSPAPDHAHVRVDPHTPLFDPFVMLASIAASTSRIRVGTNVYNVGLRHPFVTARAVATLDIVTGGRVDLGIGVSWLEPEWDALGLDFSTRGRRADESLEICRRLWTEPLVAHEGEFFRFDSVVFEPKPVQSQVPLHIGGDSRAALRRTARLGQGWIGMVHDPSSFARSVAELRDLADAEGTDANSIQRTALVADPDEPTVDEWRHAGATRLIVAPWSRSSEAIAGLERFASSVAGLRSSAER
jgi:probable F420-dependent oxidoreductase